MSDGDVSSQPVIDWSEAMQQCGDDEEFLRELLVDLRTEAETQLTNIQSIIQVITMERKLKKTMQFERQETTRPSFFFQFSHVDFSFLLYSFIFIIILFLQSPPPNPYEGIMRSAHMLKGASANLMCHQLRLASLKLEEAARQAQQQQVQMAYQDLQLAIQNLIVHLQNLGL